MQKKIFLFLIVVLISITVYSQADFRPGYIVKSSGDTLWGEIQYLPNNKMALTCIFRADKRSSVEKYTPEDIKEYRITNGRYYIAQNIPGYGRVFLEYLVSGKLNLYFLSGGDADRFYIRKEGDTLVALPQEVEYVMSKGAVFKKQPVITRGILMNATREAPQLIPEIQTIDPKSQKELINLASDYNKSVCPEGNCEVYKKNIPFRVYWQPTVGINNYFHIKGISYEAGVKLHFWLPIENEHLYLTTGLMYCRHTNYSQSFLKLPLQLRYTSSGNVMMEFRVGPEIVVIKNGELDEIGNLMAFDGALNIKLSEKRDIYLNAGAGLETVPLTILFSNGTFSEKMVGFSTSTGIYFRF